MKRQCQGTYIVPLVDPSNALGFRELKQAALSPCEFKTEVHDPVVDGNSDSQLLNLIFSIDPTTRLPYGDVQQYMSENVSPQIRDYIRQQFLQPNNGGVINTNGLSDDDISELSRRSGEDSYAYRERMVSYLSSLRDSSTKSDNSKTD